MAVLGSHRIKYITDFLLHVCRNSHIFEIILYSSKYGICVFTNDLFCNMTSAKLQYLYVFTKPLFHRQDVIKGNFFQ